MGDLDRNLDRKARCHCGSGRQYKACHYPIDRQREDEARPVTPRYKRTALSTRTALLAAMALGTIGGRR